MLITIWLNMKNDVTQSILIEILYYNPAGGKLFWKHRPQKYFPNYKSYKQWNGAWENKEAFTAFDKKGYKVGAIFNKSYKAHRIIWILITGENPIQIDHINGNKSDNLFDNLRNVSNKINHKNMGIQKNNKSGFSGIYWAKREKRWVAKITIDRKEIGLGYFLNKEDAIEARLKAQICNNFHPNHGDRIRNGS